MNEETIDKWARYFRFFYFYEDMSFGDFIDRVKENKIPQRQIVDWSKVERQVE